MKKVLACVSLLTIIFSFGGCSSDGKKDAIEGTWELSQERFFQGALVERRSGTATIDQSGSTVESRSEGTYTLTQTGKTGTFSLATRWTIDGSTITVPSQEVTFYRDGAPTSVSITGGAGTFSGDRIEVHTTVAAQGGSSEANSVLTR